MAIGLLLLPDDPMAMAMAIAIAPEAAFAPEAVWSPEAVVRPVVRGSGFAGDTASDDGSNRVLHISCVLKIFILYYKIFQF